MKIKLLSAVALTVSIMALSACTKVETGEVGVRKTWNGQIQMDELSQDFHPSITSDVTVFTVKETRVDLKDMQPKAKDNLTLEDLDVEVYYTINPNMVADMDKKYSNTHLKEGKVIYPNYMLVRSVSREAIYETISEYDSLVVHQQRDSIRNKIKTRTQLKLDTSDENVFTISKVIIRDVKTDPTIEESITRSAAMDKKLDEKNKELKVIQKQSEINESLSNSLTPEIIEMRRIEAIEKACSNPNSTCILSMTGSGASPVLNVGR